MPTLGNVLLQRLQDDACFALDYSVSIVEGEDLIHALQREDDLVVHCHAASD